MPTKLKGFSHLIVIGNLKTVIIMANTLVLHKCSEDQNCWISCEERNGFIDISLSEGGRINAIYLDKSTAIKLSKTLRTEINKIQS